MPNTGKNVNLNTYLLSALLAVAGFLSHKTLYNTEKVTAIDAKLEGFTAMRAIEQQQIVEIKDSLKTLNSKISETVTRTEMKERLENYDRRIRVLEDKFKAPTAPPSK